MPGNKQVRSPSVGFVRWWRGAWACLGALWTLPNTLAGSLLGLLFLLLGARVRWRGDLWAWVFEGVPWRGPGGAITFGNTVLCTLPSLDTTCRTYAHRAGQCIEPPVSLALHERAHVLQYMALGPFFLPAYLLCGGVSVRNVFERAADRYAREQRGWWPFAAPFP